MLYEHRSTGDSLAEYSSDTLEFVRELASIGTPTPTGARFGGCITNLANHFAALIVGSYHQYVYVFEWKDSGDGAMVLDLKNKEEILSETNSYVLHMDEMIQVWEDIIILSSSSLKLGTGTSTYGDAQVRQLDPATGKLNILVDKL